MRPEFMNWYCYVRSQTLQAKNAVSNMITEHVQSFTVAHYGIPSRITEV
jgi:hypothetical protein